MKTEHLGGKKILIVGYGKEGKATEAYLKHHIPPVHYGITDVADADYLQDQMQYDLAIKSPGVPGSHLNIPYTTATNIFFANTPSMIIGVSGTKGKSTTASLIYSIIQASGRRVHMVGNIGTPMLSLLSSDLQKDDIVVCELSSYQLSDIQYSPHISVLINLYPEHMNYHGSVAAYYAAKKRIVQFAKPTDYFVFHPGFPELVHLSEHTQAQSVPYVDTIPFSRSIIPLLGDHNYDNVRAAVTVGQLLNIAPVDMESAVQSFHSLPHRLQLVGTYAGITFYDDAISTTPESTRCALEALPQTQTIFLGGQNRGYDFHALVSYLKTTQVKNIVLFPDSGNDILACMREAGMDNSYTLCQTTSMKEAVQFAYDHTQSGFVCLLSTASPSYSIWKNFEEKGDVFQSCVYVIGTSL